MLKSYEPQLLHSRNVPDGFLADYRNGMAKCDPLIERVLEDGQVVDGASLYGPHGWPRSIAFDLLHSWGSAGTVRPAALRGSNRRHRLHRHAACARPLYAGAAARLGVLCRAASVALTNMLRAGELDRPDAGIGGSLPVIRGTPTLQHLLPPRSAEVALRVCRGQTNKEIARDMGISDQTVKEHVANLFRRFGAHNRTELVTCLLNGLSRQ